MKPFIHEDFLLQNEAAKELYHDHAADLPIIDYHCHLPPQEIAEDLNFKNLTHIWLYGDHYKWRGMRACGVDERLITGDASDREKFMAWAETVPKTLRNPLFHWTQMELKSPFGVEQLLNSESADEIWETCNELLQQPEFSARSLLERNRVEVVATTDDPTDSLEHHKALSQESDLSFRMVPTFRPDRGMEVESPKGFRRWIAKLEKASGISVSSFTTLLDALKQRHDLFHELGCRASDHGVEEPYGESFTSRQLNRVFTEAMSGKTLSEEDIRSFKSAFLYHCGRMDWEKGWVFQLHVGALRNNNTRMLEKLGRDSGFDSIGDFAMARPLSAMLDRLDAENHLPRVILYNNNPRDNEVFSTMIGNFQDGSVAGKLQHGPPWWHLDQKDGIEKHFDSLSNMGILSEFVGMTTDSRSFLSYSRHDYFRRILCNVLGDEMEKGLLPDDMELLAEMTRKICYDNSRQFFRFDE